MGAIEETLSGPVTCLRVAGNMAVVGGAITDINPPSASLAVYRSYVIFASDSGKFGAGPDTLFYQFSTSLPPPDGACPVPLVGPPISSGEIVIQDTIA